MITYTNFLAKKERKEKLKKQPNHLDLLERAALYDSNTMYAQPYDSIEGDTISGSYSVNCKPLPRDQDPSFQILLNVQSYRPSAVTQKNRSCRLEISICPEISFRTKSFNVNQKEINLQRKIMITETNLKALYTSDQSLRFLLLASQDNGPRSPQSSSNEETTTESTNMLRCFEVGYGSLKYKDLLPSIAGVQMQRDTGALEVAFSATKFPHPEIGLLTVGIHIDDVGRLRQVLQLEEGPVEENTH